MKRGCFPDYKQNGNETKHFPIAERREMVASVRKVRGEEPRRGQATGKKNVGHARRKGTFFMNARQTHLRETGDSRVCQGKLG